MNHPETTDETLLSTLRDERRRAELELRSVREAAERAERRSAFLAEASEILSASLDYEATLASLVRLAVPRIADDCVLFEVEDRQVSRRIAVAHVDPQKELLLERLSEIHLATPGRPNAL